ncbi:MAG TPA: deoxyribonuclease IV [Candidatus Acidoferrales bacterium]|nr:deoxyribonuclease IV [Candidatus Acidoferrales bacterium]
MDETPSKSPTGVVTPEGLAYSAEDEYRPAPETPAGPPAWQDGSLRIGIHTSIAGDITNSLEIAHGLGANALQIFSASPRMWNSGHAHPGSGGQASTTPGAQQSRVRFSAVETERFRARREELGLGPLVIHANYLINLASPDRVLRVRSIQAFHDELVRAVALGADYLVVHPGASRGGDSRQAAETVAQSLEQAARGIRLEGLRILIENTAGQGSALGATFSELKLILDLCPNVPLGVCIDTAHLFAAGFNIRDAQGLEKTLKAIQSTVGLARVYLVHCNDSKTALGSRVDRHQHIGKGKIGLDAFRRILNHPMLAPVPAGSASATGGVGRAFILETPIDKPGDDFRNVRTLWRLVGKTIRAVGAVPRDGFRMRVSKPKMAAARGISSKKSRLARRASGYKTKRKR